MPVPGGAAELTPRRPLRGLGARDPCAGRRRGGGRGHPSGTTAGLDMLVRAVAQAGGSADHSGAGRAWAQARPVARGATHTYPPCPAPAAGDAHGATDGNDRALRSACATGPEAHGGDRAATGVTACDMSDPLSSGVPGKMPQATRTAGRSRVTRLFSRATDGVTVEGARGTRARQGSPRVRTGPARRPRRCATPADGRQQRRRNRCPAGYPADGASERLRDGRSPGRSGRGGDLPITSTASPPKCLPRGGKIVLGSPSRGLPRTLATWSTTTLRSSPG